MAKQRWYAIMVASNHEERARKNILNRLKRRGYSTDQMTFICPSEEVIVERRGERTHRKRMQMPGYILLNCGLLDSRVINEIVWTSGVYDFIGGSEKPTPLKGSEVDAILGNETAGRRELTGRSVFEVGDTIRVIDGSLSDFVGEVLEVNRDAGTLIAEVEIFGQATKTQLATNQITKA